MEDEREEDLQPAEAFPVDSVGLSSAGAAQPAVGVVVVSLLKQPGHAERQHRIRSA